MFGRPHIVLIQDVYFPDSELPVKSLSISKFQYVA